MLNFRKIKQDFSPVDLKEGKTIFTDNKVLSVKIISFNSDTLRIVSQVQGNYNSAYECELEICQVDSEIIESNCDCSYNHDCQHLASTIFYLEKNYNQIIVDFSKNNSTEKIEEEVEIRETLEKAEKELERDTRIQLEKEIVEEYRQASKLMLQSPFFIPKEDLSEDKAELCLIFNLEGSDLTNEQSNIEFQLALKLPDRSKPLYISHINNFLDSIRNNESVYISDHRYFFTYRSFSSSSTEIINIIIDQLQFKNTKNDRTLKTAYLNNELFGYILAKSYELKLNNPSNIINHREEQILPCLYNQSIESPLEYSPSLAKLSFSLELLESSIPQIIVTPEIILDLKHKISIDDPTFLHCSSPGIIYNNKYYRFHKEIKRMHIRNLFPIREVSIPQPLFGTFVENALPELLSYGEVENKKILENFVTIPFVENVEARCDINYLDGEMDAALYFIYESEEIPAAHSQITYKNIQPFVSKNGILARNFAEERDIISTLFQGFTYNEKDGLYVIKSEKKIVEFMTEIIPKNQTRIKFNCPESLLEQFIYDDTSITIDFKETNMIHNYEAALTVNGALSGIPIKQLWECISAKRPYIELEKRTKLQKNSGRPPKMLVLNLRLLKNILELFEELGIEKIETYSVERPIWSLIAIQADKFESAQIQFSISKKLKDIQQQIFENKEIKTSNIPAEINGKLRKYQIYGINWIEKLRKMHLNGILADDMGLGKTVQAITAVTQYKNENPGQTSLIVCPTSLTYNWQEEFHKFNDNIKVVVIDGTPENRKKTMENINDYDVAITSYGLLQKDNELYRETTFGYMILDEAQHIKNHNTLNSKSVKKITALHRLILTGTPIENSINELWSLFDFLMPGLLCSHKRFSEKYLRVNNGDQNNPIETLSRKINPFIKRRMKNEVLKDLPPISNITYHCNMTAKQKKLYDSYLTSAREELSLMVEKNGFSKIRNHVLATLARLKQICCHPAIFAKNDTEENDSAKYGMLMELLSSLIDSNHKTVIFSQYTKMLKIIRADLEQLGIRFCYLDGATKDRLSIVNNFNEDSTIPIFLVSLKAGGTGLNITGADTVIHYDMWWNPAVENQATDRVHRIGQKNQVSAYKLITLGTIEEKIVELQNRKKDLVQKVICDDEDIISKLTWEDVLELLQT